MKSLFSAVALLVLSSTASADFMTPERFDCGPVKSDRGGILYDYPALAIEVAQVPMGPMLPAFRTEVTIISQNFAWGGEVNRYSTHLVPNEDLRMRYDSDEGSYTAYLDRADGQAEIHLIGMPGVKATCKKSNKAEVPAVRQATLEAIRPSASGFIEAQVSLGEKTMKVKLIPGVRMCVRAPCPQQLGRTIELPIVKVEKTGCGDTYVARRDMRPVDGALIELTLVDYSDIQCRMHVPADQMTKLQYKVVLSGMAPGSSKKPEITKFHGAALK